MILHLKMQEAYAGTKEMPQENSRSVDMCACAQMCHWRHGAADVASVSSSVGFSLILVRSYVLAFSPDHNYSGAYRRHSS